MSRLSSRSVPSRPVVVASFGKHPGWVDQVELSGSLAGGLGVLVRVLYEQGLARACSGGLIQAIPANQRVEFAHLVVLDAPDGGAVARLWPGRDTRGRTGWPFGIAAAAQGVEASWLVEQALPRVSAAGAMALETASAELVRLSLGELSRQIEDGLVMQVGTPKAAENDAVVLSSLAEASEDALARVEAALLEAAQGRTLAETRCVVRVPRLLQGTSPGREARAWAAFTREVLGGASSAASGGASGTGEGVSGVVMVLDPAQGGAGGAPRPWLDIVVGPASPEAWAGIFTSDAVKPAVAGVGSAGSSGASGGGVSVRPEQLAHTRARARAWKRLAKERGAGGPARGARTVDRKAVALLAVGGVAILATAGGLWLSSVLGSSGGDAAEETTPAQVVIEAPAQPGPAPAQAAPDVDELAREVSRRWAALQSAWAAEGHTDEGVMSALVERSLQAGEGGGRDAGALRTALARLDDERAASQGRLREWALAQRERLPSREPGLAEAWRSGLSRLAADVDPQGVTGVGWEEASQRVRALAERLGQGERLVQEAGRELTDQELGLRGVAGAAEAPQDIEGVTQNAALLRVALRARVQDALSRLASEAGAGGAGTPQEIAQGVSSWRAGAVEASRQGAELAAMIRGAYGLQEKGPSGLSAVELVSAISRSPVLSDTPGLSAREISRVRAMQALERDHAGGGAEHRVALARGIAELAGDTSGRSAFELLHMWDLLARTGDLREARPGEAWTPAELRGVRRVLQQQVLRAIERTPPERHAALRDRAVRSAQAIWLSAAAGLGTQAGEGAEGRDEQIDQVLALREDFGVGEDLPEGTPAVVAFALARRELETALGADASDDAARRAAKAFTARMARWDAQQDALDDDARAILAAAALAGAQEGDDAGRSPLLGELGPAGTGYTLAPGSTTREARFVNPDAPEGAREIVFVPEQSDSLDSQLYVATREVSAATLVMLMEREASRQAIAPLLWAFRPGLADPRDGPRTWEWADASRTRVSIPLHWLRHVPGERGDASRTAPGIDAGAPSGDSPLNYVSFEAAREIARALGCRLLKAGEFAVLLERAGDSAGENVRDATWARQAEFARTGTGAWPSLGSVAPQGDGAVSDADDGVLWLAPVGAGVAGRGGLIHLRGNIAEWVEGEGGSAMVGGVSALSGPGLVLGVNPAPSGTQAALGFADVGLRLSFDAPLDVDVESPTGRLRRLVHKDR